MEVRETEGDVTDYVELHRTHEWNNVEFSRSTTLRHIDGEGWKYLIDIRVSELSDQLDDRLSLGTQRRLRPYLGLDAENVIQRSRSSNYVWVQPRSAPERLTITAPIEYYAVYNSQSKPKQKHLRAKPYFTLPTKEPVIAAYKVLTTDDTEQQTELIREIAYTYERAHDIDSATATKRWVEDTALVLGQYEWSVLNERVETSAPRASDLLFNARSWHLKRRQPPVEAGPGMNPTGEEKADLATIAHSVEEHDEVVRDTNVQSIPDYESEVDTPEPTASTNRSRQTVTQLARDPKFRENVLDAYDEQCAVCGSNWETPSGAIETTAAHLKAVGDGGTDVVPNGIALCQLHHWAFDEGVFSVTDDYTIVVHEDASGMADELTAYDGCDLMVPDDRTLHPDQSALQHHREKHGFNE